MSACGAASAMRTASSPHEPNAAVVRLEQAADSQSARLAEIETRLALVEAEARQWLARAPVPEKPVETVHIGEHRQQREPFTESVPLVQLHEPDPVAAGPAESFTLPIPPDGVRAQLGVVPLPEERGAKLSSARAQLDDAAVSEQYRAALGALRERKYADARAGLRALLDSHPDHPLAEGAVYWLGEVHYAERRYGDALREFESLIALYASSKKRPDAMLKAGLCLLRLGDDLAAKRYFRQVREQYPTSQAARIASREGAS